MKTSNLLIISGTALLGLAAYSVYESYKEQKAVDPNTPWFPEQAQKPANLVGIGLGVFLLGSGIASK